MAKDLAVDICVIGAGAGGLSVAAGASQMGAKVALVESGKMGGDCLNYGVFPPKPCWRWEKLPIRLEMQTNLEFLFK